MKKIALLIALSITTFVGKGQNLVQNGDFELYSTCPNYYGLIDSCLFWINPQLSEFSGFNGGSPDYLNSCAVFLGVRVPANTFGNQQAHSGAAYSGLLLYHYSNAPHREYIEAPLTSTLVANNCYHFEMYVSAGDNFRYASDAIGIYFSDTAVTGIDNYLPLPFVPQINNTPNNFPDSSSWIIVSGNYTASGGENYLIIGNFKDDANTNFIIINNNSTAVAYMYIDDVSLTPCTAIEEQNENTTINIYPNPAQNELYIKSNSLTGKEKTEIIITDVSGRKMLQQIINNQSSIINIKSLNDGIYFIEITNEKNIYIKKFIKENVKQ